MLTLLLGTDWVANREAILKRMANDVEEKKSGRILIVPELISHDMERRLCKAAGDTSSRFAEVLSFTRLAKKDSVASFFVLSEIFTVGFLSGHLIKVSKSFVYKIFKGKQLLV